MLPSEKLGILKKWLMQGNDSFENGAPQKSSCSKEIAVPKKWLLCPRSYSKEVWRSSFSETKAILKKS